MKDKGSVLAISGKYWLKSPIAMCKCNSSFVICWFTVLSYFCAKAGQYALKIPRAKKCEGQSTKKIKNKKK